MTEISITLANGRSVAFDVSEDGEGPPCFLLSVRKCGSSITNNICKALAASNQRCFVDVGGRFFNGNLVAADWKKDPALRGLLRPGAIYGGFRDAPISLFADPAFIAAPKLLMIRDPRDALVSQYFSNAYSHPVPKKAGEADGMTQLILAERDRAQQETICANVVSKANWMGVTMQEYAPVLGMPNTLVLKYEDVILQKAVLIEHMARHFNMRAAPRTIALILQWADKLPEEEDPKAFVRQVLPGDHRRKLDAATIARLNTILAGTMRLFGYQA